MASKILFFGIISCFLVGFETPAYSQGSRPIVDGADCQSGLVYSPGSNHDSAGVTPEKYKKNEIYLPCDQSDWMVFVRKADAGVKIDKIVLSGFANMNNGKEIESIVISDEDDVRLLLPGGRRPFVSDVDVLEIQLGKSITRGSIGNIDYFFSDGSKFKVGLSNEGFVMGYDLGSRRQLFWSKGLANQIALLLPPQVAYRFLKHWHQVLSDTNDFYSQPDLVFIDETPVISRNPLIHPKDVLVPETIPFVFLVKSGGASKVVFAANEYREGHFWGWMLGLKDFQANFSRYEVNTEGSEFFQEGFKCGHRDCRIRLQYLFENVGTDKTSLEEAIKSLHVYYGFE